VALRLCAAYHTAASYGGRRHRDRRVGGARARGTGVDASAGVGVDHLDDADAFDDVRLQRCGAQVGCLRRHDRCRAGAGFRRLTNRVDAHPDYRGAPGRIAIDADVTAASGWHALLPVSGPSSFTGDRYQTDVVLDVNAVDRRAQAAARVIGISADQLAVNVAAHVSDATGVPFSPALKLTLTPLQLSLVSQDQSLTVTDATTVTHRLTVHGRLSLSGRSVSVADARHVSTAALLLPVAPMPTPAGRPVVGVTEFRSLVRLAERYDLLVLHWTRSGVDTFVVQDDATTFRYRTGSVSQISGSSEDEVVSVRPPLTSTRSRLDGPGRSVT